MNGLDWILYSIVILLKFITMGTKSSSMRFEQLKNDFSVKFKRKKNMKEIKQSNVGRNNEALGNELDEARLGIRKERDTKLVIRKERDTRLVIGKERDAELVLGKDMCPGPELGKEIGSGLLKKGIQRSLGTEVLIWNALADTSVYGYNVSQF